MVLDRKGVQAVVALITPENGRKSHDLVMATHQSMIDFILDQLVDLPNVYAKKMFGEYALYCDEKVVALVCDDQLFVKITPEGRALVGPRYEEGQAYPGAKPSMVIGAHEVENGERLRELIRVTAAALPAAKAGTKRTHEHWRTTPKPAKRASAKVEPTARTSRTSTANPKPAKHASPARSKSRHKRDS